MCVGGGTVPERGTRDFKIEFANSSETVGTAIAEVIGGARENGGGGFSWDVGAVLLRSARLTQTTELQQHVQ